MKPTQKAPEINQFINTTFGVDREKSITNDSCVMCKGDAATFRNALSQREFAISGLCQKCQDKVFGED
jgi:hypothetical protein